MKDLNSILIEGAVLKCKPLKDKFTFTLRTRHTRKDALNRMQEVFVTITVDCSKDFESHISAGNRVRVVGRLIPVPRNLPIGILASHVEINQVVQVNEEKREALCG